jgi:hypothetical protein
MLRNFSTVWKTIFHGVEKRDFSRSRHGHQGSGWIDGAGAGGAGGAADLAALEALRVKYIGRNGLLRR